MSGAPLPAAVDLKWLGNALLTVQAEQRALRGLVEPVPARLSALEARFSALEARFSGLEDSVNAIGLTLRELVKMIAPAAPEGA